MLDIKQYVPLWGVWQVESLIGEGSYGKVYKVLRQDYGTAYYSAVKFLTIPQHEAEIRQMRNAGLDAVSLRSFFQAMVQDISHEIELMSAFRGNSHIVSFEDYLIVEKTDKIRWDVLLRMELLQSLADYCRQNPLSQEETVKLGMHICQALELCSQKTIIHRDIKPDNIFISPYGEYKLGDFGLARQVDRTMAGLTKKGTYTYMAPEVFKGESYGASVDTYALGLVMYRFLNRNRGPFLPEAPRPVLPSDRDNALKRRMSGEPIPNLPGISPQLNDIIQKACTYNRSHRFVSAREMREALEAVAGNIRGAINLSGETTQVLAEEVLHGGYSGIPMTSGTGEAERIAENRAMPSNTDKQAKESSGKEKKRNRKTLLIAGICMLGVCAAALVFIFVQYGLTTEVVTTTLPPETSLVTEIMQEEAETEEEVSPAEKEFKDYAPYFREGNTKALVGFAYGDKADNRVTATDYTFQTCRLYTLENRIDVCLYFQQEEKTFEFMESAEGNFFGLEIGVDMLVKVTDVLGPPTGLAKEADSVDMNTGVARDVYYYIFEKATLDICVDATGKIAYIQFSGNGMR